jgi:hypothetical protein
MISTSKKSKCACGCNDVIIDPLEDDDVVEVEPYPYDYE